MNLQYIKCDLIKASFIYPFHKNNFLLEKQQQNTLRFTKEIHMDKKIKKLTKDTKKVVKEEKSLLKADKKNDKVVDRAKKTMKKKGC